MRVLQEITKKKKKRPKRKKLRIKSQVLQSRSMIKAKAIITLHLTIIAN